MKRLTDKRLAIPPGQWQEVTHEEARELKEIPVPSMRELYCRLSQIEDILCDDTDEYDLDRLSVLCNQRMTMREEVSQRFSLTAKIPLDRLRELAEADREGAVRGAALHRAGARRPGGRNKGHKLGGGAVCWLMEHPEAVTMRQDPITENDVSEEDDMSENKNPRLAEVLGVEVGERFDITGDSFNPYYVDENGYLRDCDYSHRAFIIEKLINYPDLIKRRPRWTEQEVEDAKAIRRLMSEYTHIKREKPEWGTNLLLESEDVESYALSPELFPSLRVNETVKITDIIGGNE